MSPEAILIHDMLSSNTYDIELVLLLVLTQHVLPKCASAPP